MSPRLAADGLANGDEGELTTVVRRQDAFVCHRWAKTIGPLSGGGDHLFSWQVGHVNRATYAPPEHRLRNERLDKRAKKHDKNKLREADMRQG